VLILPEAVDDPRHQLQYTTCPLEAFESRPVFVKAVEDLGMNRVRLHKALEVAGLVSLGRQLRSLSCVRLRELATDGIAFTAVTNRLEQPAPHDLERLFGRDGLPQGVDATEGLLQRLERSDPTRAARLDLRLRKRSQDDGRRDQLGGLGQCLDEGQVAVVGPAREHLAVGELPDVGDQLIDENDAGSEPLEQRAEYFLARRGACGVGLSNEREPFLAAKLPAELAPER